MPRRTYLFEVILTTVKVCPKVQLGSSIQFLDSFFSCRISSSAHIIHGARTDVTIRVPYFHSSYGVQYAIYSREIVAFCLLYWMTDKKESKDELHLLIQNRVIRFQNRDDFSIIISCGIIP